MNNNVEENNMEKILPKINELSILRRNAVKLIHKLQKLLLSFSLYAPYYTLSKLHFKLFLGKNLLEEVLNETYEGKSAARRHGKMVIKMFKNVPPRTKQIIYKASKEKFKKDLMLKAKL